MLSSHVHQAANRRPARDEREGLGRWLGLGACFDVVLLKQVYTENYELA